MAISRAELLKELLPGLNELFGTKYEEYRNTWAVYAEHDPNTGELKVTKIVPWFERDEDTNPVKITDAPDEMDAYKKFMGPSI